ncbi:hypothetical protein [Nocardia africana]|uniref:Uncharacterized protein n=1 Tax=Nocardia africana TaxID=134964 RepID=A0ABW6NI76_9NOCA
MAVEIPHDVALFLNYAGVPYPDINEDQVRALGTHVRNFANGVADTHDTATGVITDMRNVYSVPGVGRGLGADVEVAYG